MIYTNIPSLLV